MSNCLLIILVIGSWVTFGGFLSIFSKCCFHGCIRSCGLVAFSLALAVLFLLLTSFIVCHAILDGLSSTWSRMLSIWFCRYSNVCVCVCVFTGLPFLETITIYLCIYLTHLDTYIYTYNMDQHAHTLTHTHTHIYIYIYIYVYVCAWVCLWMYLYKFWKIPWNISFIYFYLFVYFILFLLYIIIYFILLYIFIKVSNNQIIGLAGRVLTKSLGDQCSFPGRVIPKT